MKISNVLQIPEKNILIVGNRSYKNLGDELILLGTVKLLLQENKKITIAAYDPEWLKKFFSQFIDIDKITFVTEIPKGIRSRIKYLQQGKMRERKLYRKTNAVIIGGGEIITEENKNSYRYRLVSLLPCLDKPRYLMGGIQVPKKRINIFLFTVLLKKTKHIFARDNETVEELKTYGFDKVEFFMDTSFFGYNRKSVKPNSTGKFQQKYIVVNVNKNAEQFLPEIIQEVKGYYNKGYAIYYVPVAKGKNSQYNDIQYAQRIKMGAEIKDQRFTILDREEDFDHFIKIVVQASIVISSRLHLFLIASFLGIPTKVYPYQKKILKMKNIIEKI
ncbi:MAG TPA: polysaccharide pyruvyl transferase family protein [Candidatus Absconditabacterales bacterium]|nr:polysaccharide pyruvyl transferase family protein [Candidatus Absconditabacterales bacterium]